MRNVPNFPPSLPRASSPSSPHRVLSTSSWLRQTCVDATRRHAGLESGRRSRTDAQDAGSPLTVSNRSDTRMDILILEVEGTLANPLVAAAVILWTAVLSGAAVLATWRGIPTLMRCAALGGGIVMSLGTRAAQQEIGSLLYSLSSGRFIDVGFWHGPPTWIAPLGALLVGLTVLLTQRRGPASSSAATRNTPSARSRSAAT